MSMHRDIATVAALPVRASTEAPAHSGVPGRVLPFSPDPSRSLDVDAEDGEDWPLIVCLLGALAVAVVRVTLTTLRGEEFGVDASIALAFMFVVPILLRPAGARLLRRLSAH
jgi:hypothetical protein